MTECKIHGSDMQNNDRVMGLLSFFDTQSKVCGTKRLYSASGRIEVLGNHTDHQNGRVLTAAISQDMLGVAAINGLEQIRVFSKGQKRFSVDIKQLQPLKSEMQKSSGLVRGIAAGFKNAGGNVFGFDIAIASDVKKGSGTSSSAAFEVIIATAINDLFNQNAFSAVQIAKIGQYAEQTYFGKPCGLMDQMASAVGGSIMIDFCRDEPSIESLDISCVTDEYSILLVHPGGSHAKLTREYANVVAEMKAVAEMFNCGVLADVPYCEFLKRRKEIREKLGERPLLRAMHFFNETKRVLYGANALKNKDTDAFLHIINQSGESSNLLLQNVYLDYVQNKSVALALALTKDFLNDSGLKGACRIHGGGFVGTTLSFIPKNKAEDYIGFMESVFGEGSAEKIQIRKTGGTRIGEIE